MEEGAARGRGAAGDLYNKREFSVHVAVQQMDVYCTLRLYAADF